MREITRLTVLSALFFGIFCTGSAPAQTTQRLASAPKAFRVFYEKFRNAVVRGDKKTVASLTRFPFRYGFDTGDEGTFTKAQFSRRYNDIFGGARKLFARKNPVFNRDAGTFSLADDENASYYVFEKNGSGYRFKAFIVEP